MTYENKLEFYQIRKITATEWGQSRHNQKSFSYLPSSSKGMPIWNAYWYPFYTLETLTAFFAYKWCMEKCTDNMFYLRIDEWGCRPRWGGPAKSPIFVPTQGVIFTIIVIGCSEVPCIRYIHIIEWWIDISSITLPIM